MVVVSCLTPSVLAVALELNYLQSWLQNGLHQLIRYCCVVGISLAQDVLHCSRCRYTAEEGGTQRGVPAGRGKTHRHRGGDIGIIFSPYERISMSNDVEESRQDQGRAPLVAPSQTAGCHTLVSSVRYQLILCQITLARLTRDNC